MAPATIFSLALIVALLANGVYSAIDEYRRNGWRKPADHGNRNNGAF